MPGGVYTLKGSYEAAYVAVFKLLGDLGEGDTVVERFENLLDFDFFAMMFIIAHQILT